MSTAEGAVCVVVAFLFLFSAFVIAHHFHNDLRNRLDCAFCQSAQALSSGAKQDFTFVQQPNLLELFLVTEAPIRECFIFVFSTNVPRAPPV
jgi:hypothetical protein